MVARDAHHLGHLIAIWSVVFQAFFTLLWHQSVQTMKNHQPQSIHVQACDLLVLLLLVEQVGIGGGQFSFFGILEPFQVVVRLFFRPSEKNGINSGEFACFVAGEIIQVIETMPGSVVQCGNVCH